MHAGAIFLGPHSGAAFGDYVAGSNHILPTAGNARFSSRAGARSVYLRAQEIVEIPESAVARAGAAAGRTRPRRRTSQPRPLGVHPRRTAHRILERTSQLMQLNREVIAADGAPKPFAGAPYNQAIRAGNFVFCAGQVGLDPRRAGWSRAGSRPRRGACSKTSRRCRRRRAHPRACRSRPRCSSPTWGTLPPSTPSTPSTSPTSPPARSTVQVAALPAGGGRLRSRCVAAD